MEDYDTSDESSVENDGLSYAEQLFGQDEFMTSPYDLDLARKLISRGETPTAAIVFFSSYACQPEMLKVLLAGGGDANARRNLARLDSIAQTWHTTFQENQQVIADRREWYPIQYAAQTPFWLCAPPTVTAYREMKERQRDTIQTLLNHGADVFRTYQQPLWPTVPNPYPGRDPQLEFWEWADTLAEPVYEDGSHEPEGWIPTPLAGYIPRCVAHALFEDGGAIELLFPLDTEHRDPLGRTIVHSACRSCMGADCPVTSTIEDLSFTTGLDSAAVRFDHTVVPCPRSIFNAVRHGDLTAVDLAGRTALHHLFEARTTGPARRWRIPFIRQTVQYLLKHTDLVNKADLSGNKPIHYALQRLRFYRGMHRGRYGHIERLEDTLNDLLDAGADVVPDARGNTALHYLAESCLTEPLISTEIRALARRFLAAGLDVNARNDDGKSAMDLLLSQSDELYSQIEAQNPRREYDPMAEQNVDTEVFGMLDDAGMDWKARNDGTLLHHIARQAWCNAEKRVEFILGKGVDVDATDSHGKTAAEVAEQYGNHEIAQFLVGTADAS